jgi:hypothetical protein
MSLTPHVVSNVHLKHKGKPTLCVLQPHRVYCRSSRLPVWMALGGGYYRRLRFHRHPSRRHFRYRYQLRGMSDRCMYRTHALLILTPG